MFFLWGSTFKITPALKLIPSYPQMKQNCPSEQAGIKSHIGTGEKEKNRMTSWIYVSEQNEEMSWWTLGVKPEYHWSSLSASASECLAIQVAMPGATQTWAKMLRSQGSLKSNFGINKERTIDSSDCLKNDNMS